jgi:hypothetical protein
MGLYLKQKSGDRYFGLTCRHCIWPEDIDEGIAYTSQYNSSKLKTGQSPLMIIQPGNNTFEQLKKTNERHIGLWSDEKVHQRSIAEANGQLQRLGERKSFSDPKHRVIGHVFFSPPRNLHPKNWLRDWALIELDTQKFDVNSLTNIVYIDQILEAIRPKLDADPRFHLKMKTDKSLKLQQAIPVPEMEKPTMKDENGDECMIVGKRGRTSKVTWGTANEVKSVTRTLYAGKKVTSLEWCVLSSISIPFSEKGDSGSVVFDLSGRVGGILTGGQGMNASTDITYVTPMEWLLQDINEQLQEQLKMTVYIL